MEPPCPVLVLAAGDVATSRSQPPKSAGTHRDCRKLSRMGPKNERQIAWTVKQAAADYEHLARLHAKIKDTAAVIERGRSAWAESVALLTGLAGSGGGPPKPFLVWQTRNQYAVQKIVHSKWGTESLTPGFSHKQGFSHSLLPPPSPSGFPGRWGFSSRMTLISRLA